MEEMLTPAQARTWKELLAVGRRRPRSDMTLGPRLRERLESALAEVADLVPAGETMWLNKSALGALDCDGRYLDHCDTPFVPNPAAALGTIAHRAIQLDQDAGRIREPEQVVAHAWSELARAGSWAGELLGSLTPIEADALRANVRLKVVAFRECFPLLPSQARVRAECPFVVRLCAGRIVLKGVPDLVVGRATPTHRRMHLLDLKTGHRRAHHRDDLRFYALLAALKLGIAPFRVSTYYLDEADWSTEDVDAPMLESMATTVAEKARRAAQLRFGGSGTMLGLVPGPACRWCSRATDCPAAPAHASRAASAAA